MNFVRVIYVSWTVFYNFFSKQTNVLLNLAITILLGRSGVTTHLVLHCIQNLFYHIVLIFCIWLHNPNFIIIIVAQLGDVVHGPNVL